MKKIVALVLSLVMVLGLATTAFAAGVEFYAVDKTAGDDTYGKFVKDVAVTAWIQDNGFETFDDLLADDDNYLPCYEIVDGHFFVEVPKAAAEYMLAYGAVEVYLAKVPSAAVYFVDEVKALTVVAEDDAECGDTYVDDAVVGYDEDDTYYASYDKKGLVDKVYVADKTSGSAVSVKVGDKLVKAVELDYGTDVVFMAHDFEGYEVVKGAYVNVKCSECDKVAELYANAAAAGKKAVNVGPGWVTFADFMDFGAVEAPATDKVESAQTFDAGIAMYVGMSVMAAAGSAVVLKKKD